MPVNELRVLTGERVGGGNDGEEVIVLQFTGGDGATDSEMLTPGQVRQLVEELLASLLHYRDHRRWALSILHVGP